MPYFRLFALWFCLGLFQAASPSHASVMGDDFNTDESEDYSGLPKLRLALETGYSRWLYSPDGISKDYDDYLSNVQSGWNYAAELAYFPWAKGGFGMNWIWFLSKAHEKGIIMDTASNVPHELRERVSFLYFGPTFLTRLQYGRFGLIVVGFGAGWLTAHDSWTDNGTINVVEASNFAVATNIGWDYSLYRFVSIGINGRFILSNVREYTYNGRKVTLTQPDEAHHWVNIPLHRLEINAGIRFGL